MKQDHSAFRAARAYADQDIVEDRVRRFLPMVHKTAWHVHGSGCEGLEIEDLVQAGLVALAESARRHAGPGEDGFAAYAKIRVRGAMYDLVRKSLPGGRGAAIRRKRYGQAREALRAKLGREPLPAELAEELGIAESELANYAEEPIRLSSLDTAYDDGDSSYADDRPDAFELLSEAEDRERLGQVIADLPERQKLVLQLYFVEELNLCEIAEILEVSVPRVHQIKAQALQAVKRALEGSDWGG